MNNSSEVLLRWFRVELFEGMRRVARKELKESCESAAAKKVYRYYQAMGYVMTHVNIVRVERMHGTSAEGFWQTFNIEALPDRIVTERAICPHCARPIESDWRISRQTGIAICMQCTAGRSRKSRKIRSVLKYRGQRHAGM